MGKLPERRQYKRRGQYHSRCERPQLFEYGNLHRLRLGLRLGRRDGTRTRKIRLLVLSAGFDET